MPANQRTSRLGGKGGYSRPSAGVLDDLTNPGTSGTPVVSGTTSSPSEMQKTPGTSDISGTSGVEETSVSTDTLSTRGTSGTAGTKKAAERRDHVKVGSSLAAEMRDAVWYLSEHGRPRVTLGELLDEAVRQWLEREQAEQNGGEAFPVRGRLR